VRAPLAHAASGVFRVVGLLQLVRPIPEAAPVTRATGNSRCFTIAGVSGIPSTAAAIVMNVTAVDYGTRDWLTVYPNGQAVPATSTTTFDTSEYAVANGAIVRVGNSGQVCVSVGTINSAPGSSNVVLDVTGYLTATRITQMPMLATPQRPVDTRTVGGPVATDGSRDAQGFRVTRPFHPLSAREYELVGVAHTWGEHRMCFQEAGQTRVRSQPAIWTDVGGPAPRPRCRRTLGISSPSLSPGTRNPNSARTPGCRVRGIRTRFAPCLPGCSPQIRHPPRSCGNSPRQVQSDPDDRCVPCQPAPSRATEAPFRRAWCQNTLGMIAQPK
jgi:hypothetical protein